MQKGDDDQQQHRAISKDILEYSTTTSSVNEALNPSIVTCNVGVTYTDIVKVLSEVELPSPSPIMATSCTLVGEGNLISFQEGQSSGTKKFDTIEEKDLENKQENLQEHRIQFMAPQTHENETIHRRGRSRIHERIRVVKELIPNCNKKDQASILDDAIEYIKLLQMQVQMMQYTGAGTLPQGFFTSPGRHESLQGPYMAPYFTMTPMMGVEYTPEHYGTYFTSSYPIYPPFVSGFNPLVQPMEVGIGTPRLCPIPLPQFRAQRSELTYSTALSSDTIIPITVSHVRSGISSQSSYHIPVTNQEVQLVSIAEVKPSSSKSFNDGKDNT